MMTSSNGNIFRVTGPFCAGNSPVPVNSPHKGQWRGALMFSLICVWINGWVSNRDAGDFRRHRCHYDVIVMISQHSKDQKKTPFHLSSTITILDENTHRIPDFKNRLANCPWKPGYTWLITQCKFTIAYPRHHIRWHMMPKKESKVLREADVAVWVAYNYRHHLA